MCFISVLPIKRVIFNNSSKGVFNSHLSPPPWLLVFTLHSPLYVFLAESPPGIVSCFYFYHNSSHTFCICNKYSCSQASLLSPLCCMALKQLSRLVKTSTVLCNDAGSHKQMMSPCWREHQIRKCFMDKEHSLFNLEGLLWYREVSVLLHDPFAPYPWRTSELVWSK